MAEGVFIDYDNLLNDAYRLKAKIKEIKDCYESIVYGVRELDGTSEVWQGKPQKEFYETLNIVTGVYNDNINKLIEIYMFLCSIITKYEENTEETKKDIDSNSNNFIV